MLEVAIEQVGEAGCLERTALSTCALNTARGGGEIRWLRLLRRHGVEVNHCTPGDFLGELGIVQRRLRTATVVSATDVLALHLDRDVFERLHATHSYFRGVVSAAITRKTA